MKRLALIPLDTSFFRDGTPFGMGSSAQSDVGSIFPPHPPTAVGAVRAALARANGWDGRGRWPEELDSVLGNGGDLGSLSFMGPLVLRNGVPFVPAPLHVLGRTQCESWMPEALLRPGPPVDCDLGKHVRLPCLDTAVSRPDELKPGDGWWLSLEGLQAVVQGELPSSKELVRARDLWTEERRVGLERNQTTRTAEDGQLYSTRHVRAARGVSLGVQVKGVPSDWSWPSGLIPLGGESRVAEVAEWEWGNIPLQSGTSTKRVALVALTPLDLPTKAVWPDAVLADTGLRLVSACCARPVRIGGWDSLVRRPRPLRSLVAPGSVLFCRGENASYLERISGADGFARIGDHQEWGFGLVAMAAWPQSKEET